MFIIDQVAALESAFLRKAIAVTGSPGLSIILLAVLLQLLLYRALRAQHRASRDLERLKPQLDALKKRYAKDQKGLQAANVQLFRINKIQPLAGCLPILITLPALFGLWRAIGQTRAWRKATFLWIHPGPLNDSYPDFCAATLGQFDLPLLLVCAAFGWLALRGTRPSRRFDGMSLYLFALLSTWPAALVLFWGVFNGLDNLIRSRVFQETVPEIVVPLPPADPEAVAAEVGSWDRQRFSNQETPPAES